MSQSLAQIYIHLVFSTKDRTPWLGDPSVREQLYAYMATILRDNVDTSAVKIGGVEDHIHALVRLSRKHPVMTVVQECKVETSKWLKRQPSVSGDFAWQGGYGAFSVSASSVDRVVRYIESQQVRHRRTTFQDEFRLLCRRHGLELDERYAWE
jgi:REP element-mobilizing transposase RayT